MNLFKRDVELEDKIPGIFGLDGKSASNTRSPRNTYKLCVAFYYKRPRCKYIQYYFRLVRIRKEIFLVEPKKLEGISKQNFVFGPTRKNGGFNDCARAIDFSNYTGKD